MMLEGGEETRAPRHSGECVRNVGLCRSFQESPFLEVLHHCDLIEPGLEMKHEMA